MVDFLIGHYTYRIFPPAIPPPPLARVKFRVPLLDDGIRNTKRGWSPGDSLNLVRVLSVRVNYSQQCRNDINGRWEYSVSIMSH